MTHFDHKFSCFAEKTRFFSYKGLFSLQTGIEDMKLREHDISTEDKGKKS